MTELDSFHWRLVAAGAAVAPSAALLAYFCVATQWRNLRELIWIAFGLGFSVAIPIAGIAALYAPDIATIESIRQQAAAIAFLEAAIPEEFGKLLVLLCILLRHEDLRRPIDAIALTVFVGLGFATIENIYYVLSSDNWTETAMLRALTAVPMHATVGVLMGYFAALYIVHPLRRTSLLAAMFLVPTLLHGFYDYPVFAMQTYIARDIPIDDAVSHEFQGIFIATIAVSVLAALAVFRSAANNPVLSAPAPWFRETAAQLMTANAATGPQSLKN